MTVGNRSPGGARGPLRAIVDHLPEALAVLDAQGRVTYANPAALRLLGAQIGVLRGESVTSLVHPDDRAVLELALREAARRPGPGPQREFRIASRGGGWLPVEARAVNLLDDPDVSGILVSVRAVAERAHLTRALRTLGEANLVLVGATEEPELLQRMCQTITETGEYLLAWVGMRLDDDARTVKPVAAAGVVGYLDEITVSWSADSPHGQGPTGRTIRDGRIHVLDDALNSPSYAPWREAAGHWGFRSSCVLPLHSHGEVIGSLSIYASEPGAFSPEAVALLEKLAAALSYGVERLRDGERLSHSLDATLSALASLIELRDPYTAGHQSRVGELTEALAATLGIDAQESRGIRIAAELHDIGKIMVPSEILTRPGLLGPEELALVRRHPQTGYDVLAGIEFPWPVAETVLQHHERLDGSGYPRGLTGEEILRGARVLAVADTVEAMTNHRPYRPGLGLDEALDTVRAGAGQLYDAEVVEACTSLLETGAFRFEPGRRDAWVLDRDRDNQQDLC